LKSDCKKNKNQIIEKAGHVDANIFVDKELAFWRFLILRSFFNWNVAIGMQQLKKT
jgi:hypothetical protein